MSSVFDPGANDRRRARKLAKRGIISGGDITGPGGISAGFDFTDGRSSVSSDLGTFAPLLAQLQQMAGGFFDQAQGDLPPELRQLGDQTIGRLGSIDVQRIQNQSDFEGLGGIFRQAAGIATQDPFDLGSSISSRLRALNERSNQRLVNRTFDRLKRTGNLTSSAGIQRAGELEQNLFEQGLQFDLAGLNFGQGMIRDAFGRALGASQQREAIGARQFAEEFGLEQLGGTRALQQFGVGSDIFRQFLLNQAQGSGLGLQSLQGASALSSLPLAFMNAAQNAAITGSNSLFAAAGVNMQNAQLASSPFLEAMKTAAMLADAGHPFASAPGGGAGAGGAGAAGAGAGGGAAAGGGASTAAGGMIIGSDRRLKQNIRQIGEWLGFNLYEWDWIDGRADPTVGLIAQEVVQTRPDVVSVSDDGFLQLNYGAL